jgi:hypothetical protein
VSPASGSNDPEPSNVAVCPTSTVRSGPASASGARLVATVVDVVELVVVVVLTRGSFGHVAATAIGEYGE